MGDSIIIQLMIVVILTLVNAFFAAAEMALVSVDKQKIKRQRENKKAQQLLELIEEPSGFLATIQVGITLAGFFSSAFAATGLSVYIEDFLSVLHVPYSHQVAIALMTIIISFIMLLFGELFPKRIALAKTETVAYFSMKPIKALAKIARPFVFVLTRCTQGLATLFRVPSDNEDNGISEEEIRALMHEGRQLGVIRREEEEMMKGVFEFNDRLVKEIMTPRSKVAMVDLTEEIGAVMEALTTMSYSRVPVFEGDKDNIIGVLLLKDLFVHFQQNTLDMEALRSLIRDVTIIPETGRINVVYHELRSTHQHLGVVVDEHGNMTGIITMEDIIEEIMGPIEDEYDDEVFEVVPLSGDQYELEGSMPIVEFNKRFHVDISATHSDTLGGYIVEKVGHLPKEGTELIMDKEHLVFTVIRVHERRIDKVIMGLRKTVQ